MNKQNPSKVLLVCIYDTVIFELTNDIIYQALKPHGNIKKILIFQRGEITKCFIQLFTQQEAIRIKNTMDGKKVFQSYCKMHIYFSALKEIDLKNQFSKGKDFSISNQSMNQQSFYMTSQDDFFLTKTNHFDHLKKSKTTDQFDLQKAIKIVNQEQQFSEKIKSQIIENILEDDYPLTLQIPTNIQYINMNPQKFNNFSTEMQCHQHYLNYQNRSQILSFLIQNPLQIKEIYNLFSNFGNIQKIIKKNYICFVQFTNIQFAVIAKDYLTNLILFGNQLKLVYKTQSQIYQNPIREYTETIVYDSNYYRFNSKKSISINPPSQVLHVSNMKKQLCNTTKLKQLFQQYGVIQKVQILVQSKQKNMALIKFKSLQDSINAIATMHNNEILGRKIQISFTKSKL